VSHRARGDPAGARADRRRGASRACARGVRRSRCTGRGHAGAHRPRPCRGGDRHGAARRRAARPRRPAVGDASPRRRALRDGSGLSLRARPGPPPTAPRPAPRRRGRRGALRPVAEHRLRHVDGSARGRPPGRGGPRPVRRHARRDDEAHHHVDAARGRALARDVRDGRRRRRPGEFRRPHYVVATAQARP